jgi:ABC-type transporter Mla subunit MlaD
MTHDERFDRIDATLERLGGRFDKMDARFGHLENYIQEFRGETISRLDRLDQRLEGHGSALASLDGRLPAFTKMVLNSDAFTAQLADRLRKLEEKVAKLEPAA